MGDKAVEYEPGDACGFCWGEGKAYGDKPTPKRVRITGSGFAGACAPCNNTFVAEQVLGSPCAWAYFDGTVACSWNLALHFSVFLMEVAGVGICYEGTEGPCVKESTFEGKTVSVS